MAKDEKYPHALPEGTILAGQYVIEKALGQGGFGITYKAADHKTGQSVAIKEFFPDSMAQRATQTTVTAFSGERGESFAYGKGCFLQEAETLAQFIGNEHIVRVFSYFEENGTAYFVMEFVEGTSFDQYIKERGGKLPYEEAERILLPVIDALAAVHAKGIVHRDVTPDNIYITKDGTVKLLDFGAARYSLGDKSRSLDVVLKHGFAPKEQYTRRGKQGPFTDVYTVGASFYFAITGKRPPDSIDRMEEDEMIPPSSLVRIPFEKEDAILKAMSVQPSNRYQTMVDFRQALMSPPEEGTQNVEAQVAEAMPLQGAAAAQGVQPRPVQQRVFTAPQPEPQVQPTYIPQQSMQQVEIPQQISPLPRGSMPQQQTPVQPVYVPQQQNMPQAGIPQAVPQSAAPEEYASEGAEYKYEYHNDGTATLCEASKEIAGTVKIPSLVKRGSQIYRVTYIGKGAFYECVCLTGIEIPEGVTGIGDDAFRWCSSLENIEMSYGLTVIGNDTFGGCSSLSSIRISGETVSIGNGAFSGCSSLKSIRIPDGVTNIGHSTFSGCSSLENIEMPDGVTSIGVGAFSRCSSLKYIEMPNGVKSIEDDAFRWCSSITGIEILKGVTSIGNSAFSGCSSLTVIEIPEGVTSIGNSAFSGCSSLTGMEIPDSVTSIGNGVFSGCSSLTNVIYKGRSISADNFNTLCDNNFGHTYEYHSDATATLLKASKDIAGTLKIPAVIMKEGQIYLVSSIGNDAFSGCSSLTGMEIPGSVTSIGYGVFSGCSSLEKIKIPEGVTSIGNRAFSGCRSLTDIEIPKGVTSIGYEAFWGCTDLTSIEILNETASIDHAAFWGCASLTTVIYGGRRMSPDEFFGLWD